MLTTALVLLVCRSIEILFSPIPHIVWRKVDATDLPANHEISESGAILHLYNVQYEDVGAYECEAINTKGKDWHKAWLYVECESFSQDGTNWRFPLRANSGAGSKLITDFVLQPLQNGQKPSTTLRSTSARSTQCAALHPGSPSPSSDGIRMDTW